MEANNQTLAGRAKELVLAFIDAMNKEYYKAARSYTADNMKFEGVLGSRDGAEAYFKDMEHMKFKYDVKKVFVNDDDVCLLYDITMSGLNVFSCGWYHVKNGKIDLIKVIFDPRPVLEAQK